MAAVTICCDIRDPQNKDNLLIKEEQFAKLFFSITTLLFTLLATAMFG